MNDMASPPTDPNEPLKKILGPTVISDEVRQLPLFGIQSECRPEEVNSRLFAVTWAEFTPFR